MRVVENMAYNYSALQEEDNYEDYEDYELINGKQYGKIDYEIIGGEKIYMAAAAPNISHGIIVMRLGTIFNNYIDENNIDAFVLADNADIYLSDESHVKPDVSIIIRKPSAINKEKVIKGAPDLVVEVLSESTKKYDIGGKKDDYEKYGVKEYWIVDPENRSIKVYHNIEGKFTASDEYKINSDKTKIKVSIFEDLSVDVCNVFKWWLN